MSYLHYLLLNSNIAAHVHSLCHSYTIDVILTAHILFHTVYLFYLIINTIHIYILCIFLVSLHFWLDA